MVKFYSTSHTHQYPFETVSLAYFLRYPNPYSTHVVSTDVIDRHFDPATNTLSTARLHLKRSKIPGAVLKILPKSWFGPTGANGETQSYILERSVVDMKDGVMIAESTNLEFKGVLSVKERQLYRRPNVDLKDFFERYKPRQGYNINVPDWARGKVRSAGFLSSAAVKGETDVNTVVELLSRLGAARQKAQQSNQPTMPVAAVDTDDSASESSEGTEAPPAKMGFFKTWGVGSIQRSIEAIGLRRTERAVPKAELGMNVVLDRMRNGGLTAVLEGMKRDRDEGMAVE